MFNRKDMDLLAEATNKVILKEYDAANEFEKKGWSPGNGGTMEGEQSDDYLPQDEDALMDHWDDQIRTKLHRALAALDERDYVGAQDMMKMADDAVEEMTSQLQGGHGMGEDPGDSVPLEKAFDLTGNSEDAEEMSVADRRAKADELNKGKRKDDPSNVQVGKSGEARTSYERMKRRGGNKIGGGRKPGYEDEESPSRSSRYANEDAEDKITLDNAFSKDRKDPPRPAGKKKVKRGNFKRTKVDPNAPQKPKASNEEMDWMAGQ